MSQKNMLYVLLLVFLAACLFVACSGTTDPGAVPDTSADSVSLTTGEKATAAPTAQPIPTDSDTTTPPVTAASLQDLLLNAQLESDGIVYIEYRTMLNDEENTVFVTTNMDGDIVLVRAIVDKEGVWKIVSMSATNYQDGIYRFEDAWINNARKGMFSSISLGNKYEWNFVYCGADAKKAIVIPEESIPSNVTVNIQQIGERYLIHVISYAEPEVVNSFDVWQVLIENGCIAK